MENRSESNDGKTLFELFSRRRPHLSHSILVFVRTKFDHKVNTNTDEGPIRLKCMSVLTIAPTAQPATIDEDLHFKNGILARS